MFRVYAEVVELVDALASGASGCKPVGVRVPPSALNEQEQTQTPSGLARWRLRFVSSGYPVAPILSSEGMLRHHRAPHCPFDEYIALGPPHRRQESGRKARRADAAGLHQGHPRRGPDERSARAVPSGSYRRYATPPCAPAAPCRAPPRSLVGHTHGAARRQMARRFTRDPLDGGRHRRRRDHRADPRAHGATAVGRQQDRRANDAGLQGAV